MEATANNMDRLLIIQMRWGGRSDRDIIAPLYESARKKLGGRSPSLVAAQRMIEEIKAGDNVFLTMGFASYPNMPCGETDGPLGVASLARAIRYGLGAVPVIVVEHREMETVCQTTRAAGLSMMDYSLAKETTSGAAAAITFPIVEKEESKKFAADIVGEYAPKAIIAVETIGPNRKGVKHFGAGADAEAKDKLPGLEYLFYEAEARGILTIGCIDQGNEIGSGTIEEDVRKITPYADVCRCPCGEGIACAIKTDIVFPAAISNWGAYGISAMLAYLLNKPEILQDADTEERMLEACIMTGACDGPMGKPIMSVDAVSAPSQRAVITLLHETIGNALKVIKVDRFTK